MALERFTSGPPEFLRKANQVVDPILRGIVLEGPDIRAEQQPDGRVMLFLTEAAKRKLRGDDGA